MRPDRASQTTTAVYRLKLANVAWTLSFLTAVCFVASLLDWKSIGAPFMERAPLDSLWSTFAQMLGVVLIFEVYMRKETRRLIQELLLSPDIIRGDIAESKVAEIMEACFWRITHDEILSRDLVAIVRNGAVLPPRRQMQLSYDASIIELPAPYLPALREMFFGLRLRVAYTEAAMNRTARFLLAHDNETYNALRVLPDIEWRWLQPLPPDLADIDAQYMTVERFSINGYALVPDDDTMKGETRFAISATSGASIHSVEYDLCLLLRKTGHVLTFSLDVPARDVTICVDFAGVPFDFLNVVDGLTTACQPRVAYFPDHSDKKSAHRVVVRVQDEWVIPKSVVAFVWRLQGEATVVRRDELDVREGRPPTLSA